jgi:hypothetical protein
MVKRVVEEDEKKLDWLLMSKWNRWLLLLISVDGLITTKYFMSKKDVTGVVDSLPL